MLLGSIWESAATSLCMDYNIRKKWVKLLNFSVVQSGYKSLKSQIKILGNNPGGKQ